MADDDFVRFGSGYSSFICLDYPLMMSFGFFTTLQIVEFTGVRSSCSYTWQEHPRVDISRCSGGPAHTKVAQLKVVINGFEHIGRNFLRWHNRKNSPLDVVVVNDSGGVKNVALDIDHHHIMLISRQKARMRMVISLLHGEADYLANLTVSPSGIP
ncbi:hypothetical protein Dimus_026198 [Dionaea muscipula]